MDHTVRKAKAQRPCNAQAKTKLNTDWQKYRVISTLTRTTVKRFQFYGLVPLGRVGSSPVSDLTVSDLAVIRSIRERTRGVGLV